MTKPYVKTTIGIIKDGKCIGVVHRSGTVDQCGHFCYVNVSINGQKVSAGGAEDRIYPFHSVKWGEIDSRQPLDMIPAIGFGDDGNHLALYKDGKLWSPGRGQTLVPYLGEPKGEWFLCGQLRQFRRVDGYLIQSFGTCRNLTADDAKRVGKKLANLEAAIRQVEGRCGERKYGEALVVSGGLIEVHGIHAFVRRGLSDPRPFSLRDTWPDEQLEETAEHIVVTLSKQTDWMSTEGLCPVCGEMTAISASFTVDGRLIGKCQDAFPIYKWVQE